LSLAGTGVAAGILVRPDSTWEADDPGRYTGPDAKTVAA
jgi:hypothetical protein